MFKFLSSTYPSTQSWCNPVSRPYQRYLERVVWETLEITEGEDFAFIFGVMHRVERETSAGQQFMVEIPSREGDPRLTAFFAKLVVSDVEIIRTRLGSASLGGPGRANRSVPSRGKFLMEIQDKGLECSITFTIEELA